MTNANTIYRKPLARFHERIAEKARDRSAPPVLIVALGDSATQGIAEPDRFLHDHVYHAQLKRKLEARHPMTTFSVINAGVDGHAAIHGLERFDRDVARHQPDLLLIAFALNDAAYGGAAGIDAFGQSIEELIQRTRSQTQADIVLLTSTMMLTRENDTIPDQYRKYTQILMEIQNSGLAARYAQRVRDIARSYSTALADVYREWESLAARGVVTTAMLSNGLNHPNEDGHRMAAEVVFQAIGLDRLESE